MSEFTEADFTNDRRTPYQIAFYAQLKALCNGWDETDYPGPKEPTKKGHRNQVREKERRYWNDMRRWNTDHDERLFQRPKMGWSIGLMEYMSVGVRFPIDYEFVRMLDLEGKPIQGFWIKDDNLTKLRLHYQSQLGVLIDWLEEHGELFITRIQPIKLRVPVGLGKNDTVLGVHIHLEVRP